VTGAPLDPRALPGPIVVVVNPLASRIRNARRGRSIESQVVEWARVSSGHAPIVVRVDDAASIDAAGSDAIRAGAGLVVAVGGDGTVAALTADLAGSGIPLAIIPGGTGNVLAAALRIPDDPTRALRALSTGVSRSIDLGVAALPPGADVAEAGTAEPGAPSVAAPEASDRLFAVAAGVGWDARVMAATAGSDKHRLGRLAYWVAALGLLGEMRPVPYIIEVDGQRLELEATVALVANAGELIPGFVRPRLPIVPDDGLLDLLVLRVASVTGGIRGALELLDRTELGGSPSGAAFRARGRAIGIEAVPAQPRQVDGDGRGIGRLEATVRGAALDVIVPRDDP
jgi:diacylglycerol kinase family enzyme